MDPAAWRAPLESQHEHGPPDMVIVAPSGKHLFTHASVLRARSIRLAQALGTADYQNSSLPITGVDSAALEQVIASFYSGVCQVDGQTVCAVHDCAMRLEVPDLQAACQRFLQQLLTLETIPALVTQALQLQNTQVLDMCKQLILMRCGDLATTLSFQAQPLDMVTLLLTWAVKAGLPATSYLPPLASWLCAQPGRMIAPASILEEMGAPQGSFPILEALLVQHLGPSAQLRVVHRAPISAHGSLSMQPFFVMMPDQQNTASRPSLIQELQQLLVSHTQASTSTATALPPYPISSCFHTETARNLDPCVLHPTLEQGLSSLSDSSLAVRRTGLAAPVADKKMDLVNGKDERNNWPSNDGVMALAAAIDVLEKEEEQAKHDSECRQEPAAGAEAEPLCNHAGSPTPAQQAPSGSKRRGEPQQGSALVSPASSFGATSGSIPGLRSKISITSHKRVRHSVTDPLLVRAASGARCSLPQETVGILQGRFSNSSLPVSSIPDISRTLSACVEKSYEYEDEDDACRVQSAPVSRHYDKPATPQLTQRLSAGAVFVVPRRSDSATGLGNASTSMKYPAGPEAPSPGAPVQLQQPPTWGPTTCPLSPSASVHRQLLARGLPNTMTPEIANSNSAQHVVLTSNQPGLSYLPSAHQMYQQNMAAMPGAQPSYPQVMQMPSHPHVLPMPPGPHMSLDSMLAGQALGLSLQQLGWEPAAQQQWDTTQGIQTGFLSNQSAPAALFGQGVCAPGVLAGLSMGQADYSSWVGLGAGSGGGQLMPMHQSGYMGTSLGGLPSPSLQQQGNRSRSTSINAPLPQPRLSGAPCQQTYAKGVCHVEGCGAELTGLRDYHFRYKICDLHLKANSILRDGLQQRFCQQCGRFHTLDAFDGTRRSCRTMLARHNARRMRRLTDQPSSSLGDNSFPGEHLALPDLTHSLLQSPAAALMNVGFPGTAQHLTTPTQLPNFMFSGYGPGGGRQ